MLAQYASVHLAGRTLPDGADPADPVYAMDGLQVTWGRASPWDQPDVDTCTFEVNLGPAPWPVWVGGELLTVGAPVRVTGSVGDPPAAGVVVFAGTVTDAGVSWETGWEWPRATVTATGAARQAASDVIGAAPFPTEPAAARLDRIEALAATGQWAAARTPLVVSVAAVDVDAQPWLDLVVDVATAVDAAAWPVYGLDPTGARPDPGAGVLIEPVQSRPYVTTWHVNGAGTGTTVGPRVGPPVGFTDVSACWADRDGVAWTRSADTMLTRVSVSWIDAAVPAEPVERTVTVIDAAREVSQGVQGAAVSTLLTTAADATALATALLVRSTPAAWALTGLVLDTAELDDPADAVAFTAACLSVMSREGHPVALMDLAPWSPAVGRVLAFVEGGTATFTAGRWTAEIAVSSIGGSGVPAVWQALPVAVPLWSWERVDPGVRWIDVAVPVEI